MQFTVFSAVMAVGCSSVIILMIHLLRKRLLFLKRFGVVTVLFLYAVCVFRILFVFEFPFTRSIAWREGLNDFYQAVYFDKVQIAGSFELNLATGFVILWLLAALFLTIIFLCKYMAGQKRAAKYADREIPGAVEILEKIMAEEKRRLPVCICRCPEIEIPMSIGIFRKMILLPDRPCSEEELYYIVKHEYTHHYHHDILTIFLVRLFCCLFWWNPLVYLLRNDVLQMLEIKCDLAVTQDMSKSEISEYLTTIVNSLKDTKDTKKAFSGSAALVLPFKRKKSFSVVERFKMVTQSDKGNSKVFQAAFLILFVALFFASYLFILQPGWDPPLEDINTNGYVDISNKGSYLIKHKDGTWSQVFPKSEMFPDGLVADISEETVKVFIKDGIEVKEE